MVALFKSHILNLSTSIFGKMNTCVQTKPRSFATLLLENWGRRENTHVAECEPLRLLFPPQFHMDTPSDMGVG